MSLELAWARLQALPDPVQEQLLRPLFEVNKSESLGPFLYASMCDALLFGVLAYQTLHWLRIRDAEERKAHNYFVAWIVVLNLAETIYLMEWTCWNFAINFGSYRQFTKMNSQSSLRASWTYIIDALVRTPVSAFYGERAWLLLNKNKLFGFILLLLGLSIVVLSVIMKVLATRVYASPTFQAVLYSWLICHLVLDILITTTLYASLWRQRKDGSTQTKWIISKAMYMMIETQLPPTLFSIAYMLVAGLKKGTTWPALFAFSGKVAGTCMLAVICHRYKLRSQINNSVAWVYESQSGGRS